MEVRGSTPKEGEDKRKGRRTKRMQRDATAVSVVRSGRRVDSFAERQQLVEGAPLMRNPLGTHSNPFYFGE